MLQEDEVMLDADDVLDAALSADHFDDDAYDLPDLGLHEYGFGYPE